tara:strand:- start:480 stop:1487 length:1008 start_codon:yes stop_codon:yes gene_type:complete
MYNVAVIGFGYWGPNIVRNFNNHAKCNVKYICDLDEESLSRANQLYPEINKISDSEIIFNDDSIDIVAIVVPVSGHYALAKKALNAGKHIFIEKPMVQTTKQAQEIIELAKKNKLVGVVDHTFLFMDAVNKIKSIIDSGEIGEITYFDSVRVNLGLFQHDIDVIWDLAPHDLSILFYILDKNPKSVIANGVSHLNNNLIDIGYLTLLYDSNMIANFHMNWLSPVKVRKILIGGTKKMIVFDDMNPDEKIKIYNKGIDVRKPEEIHKLLVQYRSGDILSPNLKPVEALKVEVDCLINQIEQKHFSAKNDLTNGLRIVKILEASSLSLKDSKKINLE